MSWRYSIAFLVLILAIIPIGCGGGGSIDEGIPEDVESAEAEFQAQFRGMQEEQGKEMSK
jgi:hypothetical protein